MAYRKLCEHLGLKVGFSDHWTRNMLKMMNIKNLLNNRMKKKAVDEIMFLIRANKYKYGKLIEGMKNNVLIKEDPFLKTVVVDVIYYPGGKTNTGVSTTTKVN